MGTNLKDKQQLANYITELFQSEHTLGLFKKHFSDSTKKEQRPYKFFGNILNYLVITRNGNLNEDQLKQITKYSLEPNDLELGTILANELKKSLVNNNITPTSENVLKLFKNNFIDNGFYIHAFNGANYNIISNNGLNGKHTFMKNEINTLDKYLRYDYDVSSYKVFATNNYHLLYYYGNLSPEWLYYYVNKNSNCIFNKDKKHAIVNILEFANSIKPLTPEQKAELTAASETVLNHYFSSSSFGLAIIDKYLPSTTFGNRVFNRYDEEEPINPEDFNFNVLISKLKNHSIYSNKYFNNNNLSENQALGLCIMYLKNKYSTYEVSTICNIEPKDMAIATLPVQNKILHSTTDKNL